MAVDTGMYMRPTLAKIIYFFGLPIMTIISIVNDTALKIFFFGILSVGFVMTLFGK